MKQIQKILSTIKTIDTDLRNIAITFGALIQYLFFTTLRQQITLSLYATLTLISVRICQELSYLDKLSTKIPMLQNGFEIKLSDPNVSLRIEVTTTIKFCNSRIVINYMCNSYILMN